GGSCGRVFLAERDGRLFALKVAPDLGGEPEALSRLRHPNIVPVEAVHRDGPLQAVALPYLGGATLVPVVRRRTLRRGRAARGAADERGGPVFRGPTGAAGGGRARGAAAISAAVARSDGLRRGRLLAGQTADGRAGARARSRRVAPRPQAGQCPDHR